MTPEALIAKWRDATLKERSAAQEHFIDLCRLLDEKTPAEADPHGEWFTFEKGARKAGGGDGWADVWRRGCFEAPFEYVRTNVKPMSDQQHRETRRRYWWLHGETVPTLCAALAQIARYIATPRVAKHRLFVWLDSAVFPDSRLYAIARDDEVSFGVLHSRIHEIWSLATCSWHGVGNDPTYNALSCFETFPFPAGLQPNRNTLTPSPLPEGLNIAQAARKLNELRENGLNPPQWVDRVPEVVPGYPDRLIPKPEFATELKKRTLTNLFTTSVPPGWSTPIARWMKRWRRPTAGRRTCRIRRSCGDCWR